MVTNSCTLVPRRFTILPSETPVEAIFHDQFAIALCRPMVQQLFTSTTLLAVLISNAFLLHFIGTSEMDILHTLNLSRNKVTKKECTASNVCVSRCVISSQSLFPTFNTVWETVCLKAFSTTWYSGVRGCSANISIFSPLVMLSQHRGKVKSSTS